MNIIIWNSFVLWKKTISMTFGKITRSWLGKMHGTTFHMNCTVFNEWKFCCHFVHQMVTVYLSHFEISIILSTAKHGAKRETSILHGESFVRIEMFIWFCVIHFGWSVVLNRWDVDLVMYPYEIDKRYQKWRQLNVDLSVVFFSHHVVQTFQMQLNTPRYNQIREQFTGFYMEEFCVVKEFSSEIDMHMSVNMTKTIPVDCIA